MDYKINHISDVEKELVVTFPKEEVDKNFSGTYSHLAKTVNLKGFRKGKVPLHVIKQFYGKGVKKDVEEFFINNGINDAVVKEELKVITDPKISNKTDIKEGQDYEFTFSVEVFPKLELELKNYEIEYTPVKYEEKMLEEEVKAFLKQFTEYKESNEGAKEGDKLTISFVARKDGEIVEGTEGKDAELFLGEKQFVEDFENSLYGKKAGEKYTTDVTFSEDYRAKELAGQTVQFEIEISKVETPENIPELTDELVKEKLHLDSVEEYKTKVKEEIVNYIDDLNNRTKQYLVIDKYVQDLDFEIPPSFLKAEEASLTERLKNDSKKTELSEEELNKIKEDAKIASKRFIIMAEFAKKLGIAVSDEELDEELAKEAMRYNLDVKTYKNFLNESMITEKKLALQDNKVLNKLVEASTFIEKEEGEKSEEK